jgi:ABC-type sulfate/molybdate transport systems ATPase subunit
VTAEIAAAVSVDALRVEAGGRTILGPLDASFAERSWTVIVGPSGSGKTTLLRAIAGLVRPAAGRVKLFGELASDGRRLLVPPERRRIGFLFQGGGAGLWPHMSVSATIDFVLGCARVPRADRARRRSELIELVELGGLERRRPGELSGGEAQRLALARALAVEPRLLLLDEPLGPLDARLRASLLARLEELHARLGLTLLHVTHDPQEARRADRTLALEAGRLVVEEAR